MPSSVIRQFRYDARAQRLFILFNSGRADAYDGVPADLVQEMRLAFSKGAFFNRKVRGQYPATALGHALSDPTVRISTSR